MAYNFESLKVLVVEDNKPMLDLMYSILKTFGVGTIINAENGDEAFTYYRKEKPDLIITDWMMQPCDGISLTRRIRNDKSGPNPFIPIILMTGFSEKRRVLSARDCGITEFLAKPFKARDLYKRLHVIIENPRKFVRSEDFFGPDRRRRNNALFSGDDRRSERQKTKPIISPEDIDMLTGG